MFIYLQVELFIVLQIIREMTEYWGYLYDQFKALDLDAVTDYMTPDEYVHQLYDKRNFSRSKFYFWAIDCLVAFEAGMLRNLEDINTFLSNYSNIEDKTGDNRTFCFEDPIRQQKEVLEMQHKRCQDDLDYFKSMRDGVSVKSLCGFQIYSQISNKSLVV